MAKRVGMTTDPDERKSYWKRQHPSLRNFKVIKSGLTYRQAQNLENDYIAKGYQGHAGGEKKPGRSYSVYVFDY